MNHVAVKTLNTERGVERLHGGMRRAVWGCREDGGEDPGVRDVLSWKGRRTANVKGPCASARKLDRNRAEMCAGDFRKCVINRSNFVVIVFNLSRL